MEAAGSSCQSHFFINTSNIIFACGPQVSATGAVWPPFLSGFKTVMSIPLGHLPVPGLLPCHSSESSDKSLSCFQAFHTKRCALTFLDSGKSMAMIVYGLYGGGCV